MRRILTDAADEVTGDPMDGLLFEVELDTGETPDVHFRYHDLVLVDEHESALGRE